MQLATRSSDIVYTPISEQKGQYEQEFRKGECSGIFTLVNMPDTIISESEDELKSFKQEEV